MGWLYYNIQHAPKEELRRMVEDERYGGAPSPYKLLDLALVAMSEAYMAVLDTRDGKVRAWTFLVRMGGRKARFNFGYKDMSEDMGPCMSRCPRRILDLLSPVDECYEGKSSEWAAKWREANRRTIQRREAFTALKEGDRIRFETPLHFRSGVTRDIFTVRQRGRKRLFVAEDGAVCSLTGLYEMPFARLCASA